jgi:GT2 family glycosyltransferase
MDAGPLAVRFSDSAPRHPASLIMPVAPDVPGPLLRSVANGAATISVVVAPTLRTKGAFAAFLESLALQTVAANVEVIVALERVPPSARRVVEGNLFRLFAGRYRLVEPGRDMSHNARINRAAAQAAGKFLLIVGADVALHDARTLETLCAMADHSQVASAGCMLLHATGVKKTPSFRSAGIFLTRGLHPPAQEAMFSELDCRDAYCTATYPVAANASALFMVRTDVWRSLGGFDAARYPLAGEGDLDYGVRAIARGLCHLATTVVSAELYEGEFRAARAPELAESLVAAETQPRLTSAAGLVAALRA